MDKVRPNDELVAVLVDIVTGGTHDNRSDGIYRANSEIVALLSRAGIDFELNGKSRLPAVRDTLKKVANDTNRFKLIWKLVDQLTRKSLYGYDDKSQYLIKAVKKINEAIAIDGLILNDVGDRFVIIEKSKTSRVSSELNQIASYLDLKNVEKEISRASSNCEADPEVAITSACSVVESVCKAILDDCNKGYPKKQDVRSLVNEMSNVLEIKPGGDKIKNHHFEEEINQILSGLLKVVQGIGTLRTKAGNAHGGGKVLKQLDSRIAHLAVNASSTVSIFYLDTYKLRKSKNKL